MKRIIIDEVGWHRNGVGGEPFHVVKFRLVRDGETTELVAVITRTEDPWEQDTKCFVINPADPIHSQWRGDVLFGDLQRAGLKLDA